MQEDQERMLSVWLRQVADDDAAGGASPVVRARLIEEMRTLRRARRVALVKMYSLAAGLVVATAMPVWQLTTRSAFDVPPQPGISANEPEVTTAFFPLEFGTVPVTHGSIVRVAVSPSAVAALGVEPIDSSGYQSDVVLADVLVGEDGLARAVRFVRSAR
jgi:hypothetical protein